MFRDYPEQIRSLVTSTREKREILKARALDWPTGVALKDIPLIKVSKAFWEPHLGMLARKLLLAFHYQCFGRILPRHGALWYDVHTNADFAAGNFPAEVLELANRLALPVRNKQQLGDQFSVRWNVVEDKSGAVFVTQLQKMLTITGITTETPEAFEEDSPEDWLGPFGPW